MGRGPWGESSGRLFYFQQELGTQKGKIWVAEEVGDKGQGSADLRRNCSCSATLTHPALCSDPTPCSP